jgi:hypothetical protein
MLCRCCLFGALGGCFAVEEDACFVIAAVFTTLLATDVLRMISCIRLVGWSFMVEGPPSCFLVVCLCWDFVGNPRITCESYVSGTFGFLLLLNEIRVNGPI